MVIVLFILFFVFFVSHRWKESNAIAACIFVMAWLLFAYNYDNPDYDNYVLKFDLVSDWLGVVGMGGSDLGFSLVMRLFYLLGTRTYDEFKFCISFVSLTLLFVNGVHKVRYVAIWAFIYLIFYTTLDITQIRNFVAFSFVINLLPLLTHNNKKAMLKYLLGVLFASTIHFSMAFFLIIPLLYIKKKVIRLGGALIVLVLVYAYSGIILSSSYYDKVDAYERTTILGALVTSFLFVSNFCLMFYLNKKYNHDFHKGKIFYSQVMEDELELGKKIAMAMLLLIPFVFINSMPIRLLRFMSLVEVGYIMNYAALLRSHYRKGMIVLCYIIGVFMFVWVSIGAFEGLTKNYIFNALL